MASTYWDGCTTSGTGSNFGNWANSTGTSSGNWYYLFRRILVTCPKCWKESDTEAFVELINIDTHTGMQVELVIHGDVLITDPSIERRPMKNFIPLLKSYANQYDQQIIHEFFEEHPIT